jgi:hypothetical protein
MKLRVVQAFQKLCDSCCTEFSLKKGGKKENTGLPVAAYGRNVVSLHVLFWKTSLHEYCGINLGDISNQILHKAHGLRQLVPFVD